MVGQADPSSIAQGRSVVHDAHCTRCSPQGRVWTADHTVRICACESLCADQSCIAGVCSICVQFVLLWLMGLACRVSEMQDRP